MATIQHVQAMLPACYLFLEEFLLSDATPFDTDDDDMTVFHFLTRQTSANKIFDYFEKTIPLYSINEFKSHFRMTKTSTEILLGLLCSTGQLTADNDHGRRIVEPPKQLLIALWFLATPECYRSVSDRFGVTLSTTHKTVRRVTSALMALQDQFIQWPTGEKCNIVTKGFLEYGGFPDCIGAIDGTHIPIRKPVHHAGSYLNRKKHYSIILQAVCDHTMCFTDVNVGWPGSVHDARVFANSNIGRNLNEKTNNNHVLGDGAYPMSCSLMTPYRDTGHLTPVQKKYNARHSSTRSLIECSFGLLKGKWRKLQYMDVLGIPDACNFVYAACILHNFLLASDGIEDGVLLPQDIDDCAPALAEESVGNAAHAKRNNIAALL